MLETMSDTLKPMMPILSLVGSTLSLGVTSYFWFVKMNREKSRMLCESVEHVSFIDLDQCVEETRWLHFRLGLAVVNESSLPNAVLHASVKMKSKSEGWQQADQVKPAPGFEFPLNLPPMQSGLLVLEWHTSFPYLAEVEENNEAHHIADGYLKHYWEMSRQVNVELRGLRQQSFGQNVSLAGSRMSSSVRYQMEMRARAA